MDVESSFSHPGGVGVGLALRLSSGFHHASCFLLLPPSLVELRHSGYSAQMRATQTIFGRGKAIRNQKRCYSYHAMLPTPPGRLKQRCCRRYCVTEELMYNQNNMYGNLPGQQTVAGIRTKQNRVICECSLWSKAISPPITRGIEGLGRQPKERQSFILYRGRRNLCTCEHRLACRWVLTCRSRCLQIGRCRRRGALAVFFAWRKRSHS